eukprot:Seg3327.2 transcript_id=Seg3327.2/GoldUCD/mRNA.D3Y31 product="hypothetical protein" protein_id=Seg3327.2/GoldUCD/D3Y31
MKYAITNRSSQGDHIMIDGRKGKKKVHFEEWEILLEHMITIEGFNGKPLLVCKKFNELFNVKNSKVNFRNLAFFFPIPDHWYGQFYPSQTVAILAHNSSVFIKHCSFRGVPVALRSVCYGNNEVHITDSIFESQFKAVVIADGGGHGLRSNSFVRNKFTGLPNYSASAVHFTSQSHLNALKSGGVPTWDILVHSCTFTYFGGSIYIGTKGTLHLWTVNSHFLHNFPRRWGPGSNSAFELELIQDNLVRNVTITNCSFVNNTGLKGGAITVEVNLLQRSATTIKIKVSNSTFKSNKAQSGGAISVKGEVVLSLTDSSFYDNFCGYSPFREILFADSGWGRGGALDFNIKGSQPFTPNAFVRNCVFKNNTAENLGGCIYSEARLILLNVYMESLEYKKGGDVFSNVIYSNGGSTLRNATIKILHTTTARNIAYFEQSLGSRPVIIDDDSKVICPKGSILRHKTLWLLNHEMRRKQIYRLLRKFSFYCDLCPPDFYSLQESTLKNSTLTGTKCRRCQSGAKCRSGVIRAKDNFWGYKEMSMNDSIDINFIQLPRGYGCSGKECVTYDVCAPHRIGTLCGTCENGYSETLLSAKCVSNTECQRVKFWLIAFMCFVIFLIFILCKQESTKFVKSQIRVLRKQQQQQEAHDYRDVALVTDDLYMSSDDYLHSIENSQQHNDMNINREQEDTDIITGFIKIIFYFYQIEYLLRAYSSDVGSHIFRGLRHSIGNFFNFEFSIGHGGAITCALFDTTPIWKVFVRISFVAMEFACLMLIFMSVKIYRGIRDKLRQLPDQSNEGEVFVNKGQRFTDRILLATFEIILLSYAVITKAVFTLLTCVQVGGKHFLFIQGTVQCYKPWQYVLMGVGFCWVIPFCLFVIMLPGLIRNRKISTGSVFFGILLPLIFLVSSLLKRCFLKQAHERQDSVDSNPVTQSILKLLTGPFKSKNKHQIRWEGVYLLRRLILVSVHSFVRNQIYKLYAMLLLQVLFSLHHVYMRPFKNKLLNMIETISLTALIMLNCVKTFAVYDAKHGLHEEGADLLLLKIFAWTELVLVLFAPVVIGLIVGVLIIARIALVIFKLFKYLYNWVVE